MRAIRIAILVAIMVSSVTLSTAPTSAEDSSSLDLGTLRPGDSRFWAGEYVDTNVEGQRKFTYKLRTIENGYRLRVGLDTLLDYRADGTEHKFADAGRRFRVTLLRDNEKLSSTTSGKAPGGYSLELFMCFFSGAGCDGTPHNVPCTEIAGEDTCNEVGEQGGLGCDGEYCFPKDTRLTEGSSAGTWTIEVIAEEVDGWSFRMRAALERIPAKASSPGALDRVVRSPNLRAVPPSELTLNCASTQGSGGTGRVGVCGRDAGPDETFTGCTSLELAHNPNVKRCLRFSAGEEVVGAQSGGLGDGSGGDLEIALRDETVDPITRNRRARAVQIRRAPDGTIDEHDAGWLEFHNSHGHWHYVGFMKYELMRVTGQTSVDEPPPMKSIHSEDVFGTKAGWGPLDERLSDWNNFNQDIYGSSEGDIHQSVGWGDIYEWQVEEQFVPIATVDQKLVEGGYYLLRMDVDHGGQLIESDETDNVSYAYFQVTGTRRLKLIQRGYGEHPWDPHKRVEP